MSVHLTGRQSSSGSSRIPGRSRAQIDSLHLPRICSSAWWHYRRDIARQSRSHIQDPVSGAVDVTWLTDASWPRETPKCPKPTDTCRMYQPSNVPVTKTIDAGDEHPPVSGETTGEEPEFDSLEPETSQLPIMVVVGASAGGVEVLREFVAGLPENFPAVVCVNLHLPAHGERYLPRILSRAGRIPANHPRTSERIRRGTDLYRPAG